jgi:hypothetical protein
MVGQCPEALGRGAIHMEIWSSHSVLDHDGDKAVVVVDDQVRRVTTPSHAALISTAIWKLSAVSHGKDKRCVAEDVRIKTNTGRSAALSGA